MPVASSSSASCAAVDFTSFIFDFIVDSELLNVRIPLSIKSCIFLGT
jgi:hypothetical protein